MLPLRLDAEMGAHLLESDLDAPAAHEPGHNLHRVSRKVGAEQRLGLEAVLGIADQHPADRHDGQAAMTPHGGGRGDLDGVLTRAIPAEYGPWWRAAQVFIRWVRHGAWERLLALVQAQGVQLGMVFLDGTIIRAHRKAAGARRKGARAASETAAKRLAAHAAAMAPGLA